MGGSFQPEVLMCYVLVHDDRDHKIYTYTIFYKRDPRFTTNNSLNALVGPQKTVTVFSDLVVMRTGRREQFPVINMRAGDKSRVDKVVAQ